MDRYREFILTAKSARAKPKFSPSSSGFGPPPQKPAEKATREEIARWRARSEGYRKDYLKKHPNSKFKDVAPRGSIITRSKRLSNKPEAREMVSRGAEFLLGLGLRTSKTSVEKAQASLKSVRGFLKAKDREPYETKANDMFKKHFSKLSKSDQNDIENETKDILNNPRERPSKIFDRKGRQGKLPALIGVALFAAMFGGLMLVSPDIAMYLGVKALDMAVESVRTTVSEPIPAFLAAKVATSFFKSRDADEYAESIERKASKRYDPNNDLDEEPSEPTTPEENPDIKNEVSKKLGDSFDPNKYEQDEAGNLKRKK